jgi:hypothetical protein
MDYSIIWDRETDIWRCTCAAATFNKKCKHIQQAQKDEKDREEMFE